MKRATMAAALILFVAPGCATEPGEAPGLSRPDLSIAPDKDDPPRLRREGREEEPDVRIPPPDECAPNSGPIDLSKPADKCDPPRPALR